MDELDVHAPEDCPFCLGDGYVLTRHPEYDDICLCEAWINDPCVCPAGEEWQAANEAKGFDAEDRAHD